MMKVLIVGCGNMGRAHALAYQQIPGVEIVGLVNRSLEPREKLSEELGGISHFSDYFKALKSLLPNIVCICTPTSFHASYAKLALKHGAHVFVEKPIALDIESAKEVFELAYKKRKKVLVGYILRHSPTWQLFIEKAKTLGKPLVMRLNLNQKSTGKEWQVHKNILKDQSPIVDCGVHYVDVMRQMTQSEPKEIQAMGARLSDEINEGTYNYGQLQITFEDGSVGWYEAGWGPMMSEEAYSIKDVVGPKGSITLKPITTSSSSIEGHTQADVLHICYKEGTEEKIHLKDQPSHIELCKKEQLFLLDAIRKDLDLSEHHQASIKSLDIVLKADALIKEKELLSVN